jgi:hypothetical protein
MTLDPSEQVREGREKVFGGTAIRFYGLRV